MLTGTVSLLHLDALLIINKINSDLAGGEGEQDTIESLLDNGLNDAIDELAKLLVQDSSDRG